VYTHTRTRTRTRTRTHTRSNTHTHTAHIIAVSIVALASKDNEKVKNKKIYRAYHRGWYCVALASKDIADTHTHTHTLKHTHTHTHTYRTYHRGWYCGVGVPKTMNKIKNKNKKPHTAHIIAVGIVAFTSKDIADGIEPRFVALSYASGSKET